MPHSAIAKTNVRYHMLQNYTFVPLKEFLDMYGIDFYHRTTSTNLITKVNTQNVSVTKIVDSSSIQCAETKYGLRNQFLALVVMIHEVWLNEQNSYLRRDTCVSTVLPDGE
jgi:hypothetical protein